MIAIDVGVHAQHQRYIRVSMAGKPSIISRHGPVTFSCRSICVPQIRQSMEEVLARAKNPVLGAPDRKVTGAVETLLERSLAHSFHLLQFIKSVHNQYLRDEIRIRTRQSAKQVGCTLDGGPALSPFSARSPTPTITSLVNLSDRKCQAPNDRRVLSFHYPRTKPQMPNKNTSIFHVSPYYVLWY